MSDYFKSLPFSFPGFIRNRLITVPWKDMPAESTSRKTGKAESSFSFFWSIPKRIAAATGRSFNQFKENNPKIVNFFSKAQLKIPCEDLFLDAESGECEEFQDEDVERRGFEDQTLGETSNPDNSPTVSPSYGSIPSIEDENIVNEHKALMERIAFVLDTKFFGATIAQVLFGDGFLATTARTVVEKALSKISPNWKEIISDFRDAKILYQSVKDFYYGKKSTTEPQNIKEFNEALKLFFKESSEKAYKAYCDQAKDLMAKIYPEEDRKSFLEAANGWAFFKDTVPAKEFFTSLTNFKSKNTTLVFSKIRAHYIHLVAQQEINSVLAQISQQIPNLEETLNNVTNNINRTDLYKE